MKLKVASTLYRTATIDRAEPDAKKLRLSISSDEPYKRYNWMEDEEYWEVLDHSPGAIKDERLKAGMPLLYNHDRDTVLGRSEGYECDGHRCYVEPVLSEADDVRSHVTKIREGTLKDTSIGYELVGKGVKMGEKEGLPIYKFGFRIFESSVVSIPADISVGVGRMRDLEKKTDPKEIEIDMGETKQLTQTLTNEKTDSQEREFRKQENQDMAETATPTEVDVKEIESRAQANERNRVKKITELSRHFAEKGLGGRKIDTSKLAEQYILDGKSEAEFRDAVMEGTFADVKPIQTPDSELERSHGGVRIIGERETVIEAKSLGELFVKSKSYLQRSAGRQECRLQIEDRTNFRATFTTGSVTNWSPIIQLPNIQLLGVQRPTVADLLSQGVTNLAAVPYVQELAFTNAATGVEEGAEKPEATFTLEQKSAPVKKIAVTIPVTDEAFEDLDTLRSYIDNRLRLAIEMEEERQLLKGDGNGANIKGILETSGIQTHAKGADTVADALYKAITKVKFVGFAQPSGIVMHPNDFQDLRLSKDANNQYFGGGPFVGSYGQPFADVTRVWGLPVVETTSMTENTALILTGSDAMIFRKKGLTIDSTNSHAEEFTHNIVRLRAEERLAFAVFRPKSFITVTSI